MHVDGAEILSISWSADWRGETKADVVIIMNMCVLTDNVDISWSC